MRAAKETTGLAIGTQQKMIAAARMAYENGYPINTYLSVRWDGLFNYEAWHHLRQMKTHQRIRYLVELIRKWLTYRELPAYYLWSREFTETSGEHWHLALHLPKYQQDSFGGYLEKHLLEPLMSSPRLNSQRTRGEFACSVWSSWHLASEDKDGKLQFTGYYLAAYTAKGEPSSRSFRGKKTNNTQKSVRGKAYGGTQKDGHYDAPQGQITGTPTRKGRYDIARSLK